MRPICGILALGPLDHQEGQNSPSGPESSDTTNLNKIQYLSIKGARMPRESVPEQICGPLGQGGQNGAEPARYLRPPCAQGRAP